MRRNCISVCIKGVLALKIRVQVFEFNFIQHKKSGNIIGTVPWKSALKMMGFDLSFQHWALAPLGNTQRFYFLKSTVGGYLFIYLFYNFYAKNSCTTDTVMCVTSYCV